MLSVVLQAPEANIEAALVDADAIESGNVKLFKVHPSPWPFIAENARALRCWLLPLAHGARNTHGFHCSEHAAVWSMQQKHAGWVPPHWCSQIAMTTGRLQPSPILPFYQYAV